MLTFNHFNYNVRDLSKSIEFYKEALGLSVLKERESEDGSFKIVFMGDSITAFRLELTWLRDHPQAYDLGEEEYHLAMTADDFGATHEKHAAMDCICYENLNMGVYFIKDPDGYWLEIVPKR